MLISGQGGKLIMYKVFGNTFSQVKIRGEHVLLCKSPQSITLSEFVFYTKKAKANTKTAKKLNSKAIINNHLEKYTQFNNFNKAIPLTQTPL